MARVPAGIAEFVLEVPLVPGVCLATFPEHAVQARVLHFRLHLLARRLEARTWSTPVGVARGSFGALQSRPGPVKTRPPVEKSYEP